MNDRIHKAEEVPVTEQLLEVVEEIANTLEGLPKAIPQHVVNVAPAAAAVNVQPAAPAINVQAAPAVVRVEAPAPTPLKTARVTGTYNGRSVDLTFTFQS